MANIMVGDQYWEEQLLRIAYGNTGNGDTNKYQPNNGNNTPQRTYQFEQSRGNGQIAQKKYNGKSSNFG